MFRTLSYSVLLTASACLPLALRAQVVDDIDNVHPSWTLSQLRPTAWQVQVGGMDWLPDGRMLVLEHVSPNENHSGTPKPNGRLWVVDNPSATGEAIIHRLLVDQLKEPVGVLYVNGKVFISEKNQLNEYTLDAAVTNATKTRTVATIPHDSSGNVNFQEYAFGLLYKDGYFYIASGGAVKGGGNSFDTNLKILDEVKVGCLLKIKDSDGSIEMVNGGMRASNGIAWGPEGSIWLTDNQGSYRPASEITAIIPGGNYGYPNKPNAFSAKPVTPPSLWGPHGEITRSPTYPHLVQKGLYAGQFLVGDLSQGGIKRIYPEKVNGAWQGAIFSFTGGLEVGIEKILEDSNGVLYVGGMGRGDNANWGWNGKKWGLQKLTPKLGSVTFEMLAIRSRKTGMEIEFSKPVGPDAGNPANYEVMSGSMQPQSGYGRGYVKDPNPMAIKSVTVSPDKKKVFLELNGLTENKVLTVKTLGVKSETGETPRCPAGWYTLNAISQTDAFATTGIVQKNPALADANSIHTRSAPEGLRVNVPFDGSHSVVLSTLQGRQVAQRAGTGAQEYAFPSASLRPGLYLLQVQAGGKVFNKTVAF